MKTIALEDKADIEAIISRCDICYVGMVDKEGFPYVIPMNFGYKDNTLYLHSAPTGHIIDILACSYRMKAKSVICRGKVEFVEELDEKRNILDIIMLHYSGRMFEYGDPAVRNVKIWKVCIEEISAKEYGAPH